MFKNAGKKLGTLIKISFFLSASAAFLIPMCILYNTNSNDGLVSLICIVVAFLMPVILYILHLTMYAFAELCENVFEAKMVIKEKIPDINEDIFLLSKNIYEISKTMNIDVQEKNQTDTNP